MNTDRIEAAAEAAAVRLSAECPGDFLAGVFWALEQIEAAQRENTVPSN